MKYIGRPRKYQTPEEMQVIIEEYFNECREDGIYPTVSMLAYRLDMGRQALVNYEKCIDLDWLKNCDKELKLRFMDTIRKAKQYIEGCYEEKLVNGKTTPIGTIFTLKNNYGWVDKQEINTTTDKEKVDLSEFTTDELREIVGK